MVSEEELKKAIIDIMKDSNDLESAKTILEAVAIDNYYITAGRVNIVKVAMKCILEYLNNPRNLNITETRRENVKLKEIEKSHKEENGKLRVELEQEKARNEKLQYKIDEKELIIDGMKEDRRIAIEEIREEYYISKDKIEKIRKNYLKKALDIEAINMFKGTTEKEREEIKFYRNIAEILKLILEEV